ncbi:hypothetical protein [Aeromicrobium sp. CTD01-1L150]|uniref:hypothetical protein n=1 Tax=Aeromicrobium sp. CTD01-1L150 TaxID=3341830 RepID=UPI0035BEEF81
MEHTLTLDDDIGTAEHDLGVGAFAEIPLATAEHDRYDIDRHLVDKSELQRLSTDVTGTDADVAVACSCCARATPSSTDPAK